MFDDQFETGPDEGHFNVRRAFDAPWPGPRGPQVWLSSDGIDVTIRPFDGCRMTSLSFFGHQVLRPWTPERKAFQYGCFPMIPWVGRLRGGELEYVGKRYALPVNKPPHALHGLACFAPWQIVQTAPHFAEFRYDLAAPWPWRGRVIQRYSIYEGALELSLKVETEEAAFPAAAGWHPWFRKDLVEGGPRLAVHFSADWQEEPGDDETPSGRRIEPRPGPWDDCFGFVNGMEAQLVWEDILAIDVSSPACSMVVFDKQPDATCVEPLSGPPNGVNTVPHVVTRDYPLEIVSRWKPRLLA